jgi:large subunit ribosomal protein L3
MTRYFDKDGVIRPVTLLKVGPCSVTLIKTAKNDGYNAVQLGYREPGKGISTKPYLGQFTKLNIKPFRWLKEVRIDNVDGFQPGQEIKVDIFKEGEYVDVTGRSKGKGFAGVMKRHNFSGGPKTHGQSHSQRAPGAAGSQRPQRIRKGTRMAGHMGDEIVTVQRLIVEKVVPEENLLVVRGSVSGNADELILIRKTMRKKKAKISVEAERHAPKGKGKAPREEASKKKK